MRRFLKRLFGAQADTNRQARRAKQIARPRLGCEGLEDRSLPSTFQIVGGVLTYTASAGAANAVAVSVSNGTYTVSDAAEAINVVGLPGATGGGTNAVTFSAASVPAAGLAFNLGDANDAIGIGSSANPITVRAGDGNDTIDVGTSGAGMLASLQGNVVVDGGVGADSVRVNDTASFIDIYTVTANQVSANGRTVTYGATENMTVNGATVSSFNVRSTAGGVQTTLNSGVAGTTFNLGSTDNLLDGLRGAVTLNGRSDTPFANNQVNLHDEGSGAGRAYTFQANSVTRTGLPAVTYNGVQGVTLNAGVANDAATVLATAVPLFLNMGAGNDVVNLGNATTPMDGVAGLVTVNGGDGADTINLNDQADANGNSYVVNNNSVTRFHFSPDVSYGTILNYATAETLNLNADNFDNLVTVESTLPGTAVNLKLGGGNDVVFVRNANQSLDDILGTLTVDGQAGSDSLDLNDEGEDVNHNYTITATSVVRDGVAPVNYANLENLTVTPGSAPVIFIVPFDGDPAAGNQFFVKGTALNTTTTINGQIFDSIVVGSDARSLDGVRGALNATGGTLTLNDQGDNNGNSYTITSSTVTRSGAAPITYHTGFLDGLTVNAGAFNDTVNLQSAFTEVALNMGAGNDTVTLNANPSTGLAGIGFVNVQGGDGTDAIVLNDNYAGIFGSDYELSEGFILDSFNQDVFQLRYNTAESVTLNAGSGSDTFSVFSATTPLTVRGGAGNDTFKLGDPGNGSAALAGLVGKVTLDGGADTNTLDYSALTTGIRVNLALGTASGASGGIKNFVNVTGGRGNDILVGNDQSNFLLGGDGRDILIGRGGQDLLLGEAGDDILIGDGTVYDLNPSALEGIMAEWGRTDLGGTAQEQYAARVNHLVGATPGGLNGTTRLDLSKVVSDGVGDGMAGGSELDWYFVSTDDVLGLNEPSPGERVN